MEPIGCLYHAIDVKNPVVSSGANRRVLMLDKVIWKDGWPEILNTEPSMEEHEGPFSNNGSRKAKKADAAV